MQERFTIKSIEKSQKIPKQQPTIKEELERVEILSKFFHRLDINSLRVLEEMVFPTKECKAESNV